MIDVWLANGTHLAVRDGVKFRAGKAAVEIIDERGDLVALAPFTAHVAAHEFSVPQTVLQAAVAYLQAEAAVRDGWKALEAAQALEAEGSDEVVAGAELQLDEADQAALAAAAELQAAMKRTED